MAQQRVFKSQWGWIGVATGEKGLTHIVLTKGSRRDVKAALPKPNHVDQNGHGDAFLDQACAELLDYLSGKRRAFSVPVDLSSGTSFQRKVWRTILRIPYGRARSYQWVAERVGGRHYARAVGTALGANPVPIVVPCHRIVAQDGSLGGFSCGLPVKRRLLKLEGTLSQLQS